MDLILLFIDSLQIWHFFIVAILFLGLSALIGDTDILPWISFSLFLVGLMDYFGTGALPQLIALPVFIFISILLARKLLYSDDTTSIAEDIDSMKGQKIRVIKVASDSKYSGEGMSTNGKRWNIKHCHQKELENDSYYLCMEIEGLTLLVDHIKGE
ncbi:uncharacterized protein METZ01_LOCUS512882 [marine metagenome]|uniref:NfeD-like C-terminal domain-containing protein n=1 Tax=marine metagenome TaxID=408172 RepID=A0A383EVB5_9ZZZZ